MKGIKWTFSFVVALCVLVMLWVTFTRVLLMILFVFVTLWIIVPFSLFSIRLCVPFLLIFILFILVPICRLVVVEVRRFWSILSTVILVIVTIIGVVF